MEEGSKKDGLRNSRHPEMIHQLFQANQKAATLTQLQQAGRNSFSDEPDLFDCYVSVTALNPRYYSAKKIIADRLSKIARHNIYATLDRVQNARTLVLLRFLFYNIIRFRSTLKFQENCVTKPFPSSNIAVEITLSIFRFSSSDTPTVKHQRAYETAC